MDKLPINLLDNYIYLYHLDEYLLIPEYPDEVSDRLNSSFSQTNALSRTSPVLSYSNSGPRVIVMRLHLHRDMIDDLNIDKSNFKLEIGEDYIDALIRKLQAVALPSYESAVKSINPPMVAMKIGNDIFIKGVVTGGISISYQKPVLDNGKYAQVEINFEITEIDPYDAESVSKLGSFRGITSQFKDGIYKGE